MPGLSDFFWRNVRFTDDCWLWQAHLVDGYGRVQINFVRRYAHVWAYEDIVGPVPEGLTLDHLCRVRHCVNPAHLEPVTGQVNVLRGETVAARNAAKTHCKVGHPLVQGSRQRFCRICANGASRAHTARKRTAA